MRIQHGVLIFAAGLLAAAAQAQSRTWDGGSSSDSNWKTADNWDGAAPVPGDALFFGGSLRLSNSNDFDAGTSFSGLAFNSGAGAFWLSGSGVSLGGGVTNFSTAIQTIGLPLGLDATRTFCASNGALVVTNTISGAGGLIKAGAQPLTLAFSNSYAGATSVKAGGVLRVTHGWALGATNGTTTAEDGSIIELYGGITVPESIALYGDASTSYGGVLRNKSGSNVISGVILNGSRIKTNSGSLDLIGGVTGSQLVLGADSGFIRVAEKPITLGGNNFFAHSSQPIILAVANNTWGTLEVSGNYLRTDVPNALAASGQITLGSSNPSGINLNGNDQTIAKLVAVTNLVTHLITSASPATLTLNQSIATTVNAGFAGAANFVKTGTGSVLFTNTLSTTAGSLTVSNGTVVIEYGAGFSASTNVIVAGGTLELRHGTSLWDSASVFVNDGAKVKIGTGLTETVGRLFVNGVQQPRGTFGTTSSGALFPDNTHFDGTGVLNVASSPAVAVTNVTWDADGGADTLLSQAANWAGNVTPAFDGTPAATFGTGGSAATVDVAVALYGLTFSRDGNFALAAGAGVLTNGAGGIFAQAPNATARTYAIAEDIVLGDNQTWAVATNNLGVTTLNITGSIDDGLVPCGLVKTQFGTLNLYTNNTFDGAVTVSNGVLRLYSSNALGSTNGNTVVNGFAGCNLCLSGNLNLSEPLVLNGEKDNAGTLRIDAGSNTLSGPVALYNQVRLVVYTGALSIEGGMAAGAGDAGGALVINSGTATYIRNKPLLLGAARNFYTDSGGLTVVAVTNNTWGETQVMNGTLRLDAANALPAVPLRLGVDYGPAATVDLNGYDQTVSKLYLGTAKPATRTITSAAPARLTVNQGSGVNTLFDARFTGAVSLLKLGAGALTLTNAFTSTSGGFAVSNGTLLVTRDGTFGSNSLCIAVGGAGTLTLSNSVAIADAATLTLPAAGVATAKIDLALGVNESVRYLYLGGKQQHAGTYGSNSSPATNKDTDHFSGPGMLTVLCDDFGTLIRLQ